MFKFEGKEQDDRVGLEINKVCVKNNPITEWSFEIVISILLVRHIVELVCYDMAKKGVINPIFKFSCCGKEFGTNKLIWAFMLSWIIFTFLS